MKSVSIAPIHLSDNDETNAKHFGDTKKKKKKAMSSSIGASSEARRAYTVDGNKLRHRLLRQLGIVPADSEVAKNVPSKMLKVEPFSIPLKYGYNVEDDENQVENDRSVSNNNKSHTQKRQVAFDDSVSVISIPRHDDYSQRIRSRLWTDKRELRNMAARNTLEYQAEGFNWRNVAEEADMITTITGERIHPVHLRRLFSNPWAMRSVVITPYAVPQRQQQSHISSTYHTGRTTTISTQPQPLRPTMTRPEQPIRPQQQQQKPISDTTKSGTTIVSTSPPGPEFPDHPLAHKIIEQPAASTTQPKVLSPSCS